MTNLKTSMENLLRRGRHVTGLSLESAIKADIKLIAAKWNPSEKGDWPGTREKMACEVYTRDVGLALLKDVMDAEVFEFLKQLVKADEELTSISPQRYDLEDHAHQLVDYADGFATQLLNAAEQAHEAA